MVVSCILTGTKKILTPGSSLVASEESSISTKLVSCTGSCNPLFGVLAVLHWSEMVEDWRILVGPVTAVATRCFLCGFLVPPSGAGKLSEQHSKVREP